jgi:7-cyano-7-deazaguanine reductase
MNELTHLGKVSPIQDDPDKVVLDKIPNPNPHLTYCCRFVAPEMSSLCPQTRQPDFATLIIDYSPRGYLLESKALKLYLFAFRNHGSFHEDVTVSIGKRIYDAINPRWLRIAGFWNGRGGIAINVVWEEGTLPENVHPLSIDNIKLYNNGHY